jgi:catechol 2,3-dioxygenase
MKEIKASLARIELFVADVNASASFYEATYGLSPEKRGDGLLCLAAGRELGLFPGEAGQLRRACFRFDSADVFAAYRNALQARSAVVEDASPTSFSVRDPEGRVIAFEFGAARAQGHGHGQAAALPEARLQHFAVRSPDASSLVDFYVNVLGFVLSDRVLDAHGDLTAAFLRTDAEHHAMAIFRAPGIRFDHFSCETPSWNDLRQWADHMAAVGVDLAWGVGRHGPGNDTFLMVKDPDGNLAEVSSDLEVCAPDRPVGEWPHRPQTLNRWGVAIMRS